jgi:thiamine-monophosphate kinase
MIEEILENRRIDKIARTFISSPHKVGKIHEVDAEIIDWDKQSQNYLALTTDALVEEVSSGLYSDPYFLGWMLAMVNFSDLAAVGAEPLGMLLSIAYSPKESDEFLAKLADGISDACQRLGTFVLGGDTNLGERLFLCGCAVGIVPKTSFITRKGAQPGDRLYMTQPAGLGNVYAFLKMTGLKENLSESFYQPVARLKEGKIIRKFANCCMDTSDGVIHTVDTLMRQNHSQFVIHDDWERILHPIALQVCRAQDLPPWLALTGVHGEFELCFTLSPQKEDAFLIEAAKIGWHPILIGKICEGKGVSIRTADELVALDTAGLRNLADQAGTDPLSYIKTLMEWASISGIK